MDMFCDLQTKKLLGVSVRNCAALEAGPGQIVHHGELRLGIDTFLPVSDMLRPPEAVFRLVQQAH